jgi:hypothetical protein
VAGKLPAASVLLADYEVGRPPLHLTVVGHKDDPAAKALFLAALQYPSLYKRLEWWDTREGKLPNPDVQYPAVQKAAAYVCTERTCSAPIFKAEEVAVKVNRVLGLQGTGSTTSSLHPAAPSAVAGLERSRTGENSREARLQIFCIHSKTLAGESNAMSVWWDRRRIHVSPGPSPNDTLTTVALRLNAYLRFYGLRAEAWPGVEAV